MTVASSINRNTYTGNGSVNEYDYTFRIFENTDLTIFVRNTSDVETELVLTTDYTVSGVGLGAGGSITLVSSGQAWLTGGNLTSGYVISIRRKLGLTQETDIRNQGDFYPESHEDQFDRSLMIAQQQQDELDRSIKLSDTIDPDDFDAKIPASIVGQTNVTIMTNVAGDGFVEGPTAGQISAAQGYAVAAAASATAADVSEAAALASETAAALSAAAAQTAVDSVIWRDVVFKTFADTPISVVDADRGKLIAVNCTGGNVVINLPSIAALTLTDPWAIGIKKTDSSVNTITINRNGSDTINGGTSLVIDIQGAGAVLIPDIDTSPDEWTSQDFGTVQDGSVTAAKLNSQVFSDLTAVISEPNDYVALADSSDSNNKKKALVSSIKNRKLRSVTTTDSPSASTDELLVLSGASFTLTLPTAIGNERKVFELLHNGTSFTQIYTLNTTSGQTIGGIASGSYALYTNGEMLRIVSDGANWLILDHRAETGWIDGGAITIGATTTAPTKASGIAVDKLWYKRSGSDLLGRIEYRQTNATSAANGTGDYLFTAVPASTTIDTTKVTLYNTLEGAGGFTDNNNVGTVGCTVSTATGTGNVSVYSTTQVRFMMIVDTSVGVVGSAYFNMNDAATRYTATYRIPISGWQP